MSNSSLPKLPHSKHRRKMEGESVFDIKEGGYYQTRGNWIARVVYVSKTVPLCYAIHNPGSPLEVGPVAHEVGTGYAVNLTIFNFSVPPAYEGHPADLMEEVRPT